MRRNSSGGVGRPPRSLKLWAGATHNPHGSRAQVASHPFFDRHRNHVELQQLVELVGRNLRLVAFPEALVGPRCDRLPGKGRHWPTWRQLGALRFRHADRDLIEADDLHLLQVVLDLLGTTKPGARIDRVAGCRRLAWRLSPHAGQTGEQQHGCHNRRHSTQAHAGPHQYSTRSSPRSAISCSKCATSRSRRIITAPISSAVK